MKLTETEEELEIIEKLSLDICREPENPLSISLQVNLGKVTMSDGTNYTISQSGMTISVSPEGCISPKLSANLGKVVTHMAGILHKGKIN